MNQPKRRGRPPKPRPEIVQSEGETPATIERPAFEPERDQNPVRDPFEAEVECPACDDDPNPADIEAAKESVVIPEGVGIQKPEPAAEEPKPLTPPQIKALDRDYDGEAGGSRPVASLTDLQRQAYVSDAMSAYEGQEQYKRTDSFNRTWEFRHDVVRNHDMMLIRADRGPIWAERHIPSSQFTPEQADAAIRDIDRETSR